MSKRLMLVLLILAGTSFLLVRFILLPQRLGSIEKSLTTKTLEKPFDLKTTKERPVQIESIESPSNDESLNRYEQPIWATVTDIETELENNRILERLNANDIDAEERVIVEQKLQLLDDLRAQELEQQLEAIKKEVAELAIIMPERLRTYGIVTP